MADNRKGYLDILLIDDDRQLRDLVSAALRSEGHQVIAAGSAEEGLEQLPYFTFEVAFLDHHLPGMEGLVLGEYLRQNNPLMQIALVTGAADERLHRLAASHGILLIEKPFDIEQLLDVVATYERRAAERADAAATSAEPGYALDVAPHLDALTTYFDAPGVPQRIEDLVARKVRFALDNLRFGRTYHELDRVAAYVGLLAAAALGLNLPRQKDGLTLFEHYDALMSDLGKAPAFRPAPPPSAPPGARDDDAPR